MVFRKVIGFGDSSFVISLPKKWVDTHKISKGDTVNVEEDGVDLKIIPGNIKQNLAKTERTINFYGNLKVLKSQLFNSYINDYNIINIYKKDITQFYPEIKKLVSDFIALEVVQASDDKIILKDYLNIQDISIYDTIRRIDRMVLSMFEDTKSVMAGDLSKIENIKTKDEDVNRLHNLVLKLLKKALNPGDRKILNLHIEEIFYYWDLVESIEETADQLKRVVRYVDEPLENTITELFKQVFEHYKQAIKANFSRDEELALEIMNLRKEVWNKCEDYEMNLGFKRTFVLERIKLIHNCAGNIARSYIKLGVKSN